MHSVENMFAACLNEVVQYKDAYAPDAYHAQRVLDAWFQSRDDAGVQFDWHATYHEGGRSAVYHINESGPRGLGAYAIWVDGSDISVSPCS